MYLDGFFHLFSIIMLIPSLPDSQLDEGLRFYAQEF